MKVFQSLMIILMLALSASAISVSSGSLDFAYQMGGSTPPAQNITVTASSPTAFTAEASGGRWLSVSMTSGTTPATLAVSINPAGLNPGTYSGTITITTQTGNSISRVRLSVTLEVTQSGDVPQAGAMSIDRIANAASFQPATSSKSWLTIFGKNFVTIPAPGREWRAEEIVNGVLPTSLEGVSVLIDNKPAAISFIGPNQINVQVPDDDSLGPVAVEVIGPYGSVRSTVDLAPFAPALFAAADSDGVRFAAALHADGSPVGSSAVSPKASPARPGEIIMLYGTGFGRTDPDRPAGEVIAPAPLASDCIVRIGGVPTIPLFAGLILAGLYQFNVQVPALPDGNQPVEIEIQGAKTQAGVLISIQQ